MQRSMMCVVLTVGIFTSTLWAYSGGSGTADDPYQIAIPEDLIELGNEPNNYDKHFVLTADIDLSGYAFERAVIAPDVNDDDSGYQGTEFTGPFDGQGYVIRHLNIKGVDYLGLFGCCASDARISNLGLEAVDVTSVGDQVGGLVGNNSGTITSCYSTGSVSGNGYVRTREGESDISTQIGGLVGDNSGTITSCYSAGTVFGYECTGGLVGRNSGAIASCHSTGAISGYECAGGFVGRNSGTIMSSYSTGTVDAASVYYYYHRVGGLVGDNSGTITSCYNTGSVSAVGGHVYVGGLVGRNYQGVITSSFNTGSVRGYYDVGGLVGGNSGAIEASYSTGDATGHSSVGGLVGCNDRSGGRTGGTVHYGTIMSSYSSGTISGSSSVGGLVGSNYADYFNTPGPTIMSSFWDMETSGRSASDGGIGLMTAEMQTASTFLNAGWDFVGESENGPNDVWKMADGLDYPRLGWEPYDGQVTVELGQTFPVTLESNPSTGYSWEWIDDPNSIVEQVGQAEFISRETDDPFTIGAGGWEVFTFQAVSPGQMTLELVYRRPWEESTEPLKTFSLHVTVP